MTATFEKDPQIIEQVNKIEEILASNFEPENEAQNQPDNVDLTWTKQPDEMFAVPAVADGNEREGYTITTPVLSGCIAEGDTLEDALKDFECGLRELLKCYVSEGKNVPWEHNVTLPLNDKRLRFFAVTA